MNPDPLTPLDYDQIWQDGFAAAESTRPSGLWALLLGVVVGATLAFAFGFLVGKADAAPRPAHLSAIPVVDDGRTGAPPELTALPRATPSGTADGAPLTGVASWYPARGLIAAAGPGLRHGAWRGSSVTVSANGHSVTVELADWCQCYGSRLLDLSDDAFAQLAPLSRGIVRVTVAGVGPAPTLPATDSAEQAEAAIRRLA